MRTITLNEIAAEDEANRADIARRSAAGTRLVAQIKKSSKYFGQSSVADRLAGRLRTDAEVFPVVVVDEGPCDYVVAGGPGGRYRLEDVDRYAAIAGSNRVKIT